MSGPLFPPSGPDLYPLKRDGVEYRRDSQGILCRVSTQVLARARKLAARRSARKEARSAWVENKRRSRTKDDREVHVLGAVGELVVASLLDLEVDSARYHGGDGGVDLVADGLRISVRTRDAIGRRLDEVSIPLTTTGGWAEYNTHLNGIDYLVGVYRLEEAEYLIRGFASSSFLRTGADLERYGGNGWRWAVPGRYLLHVEGLRRAISADRDRLVAEVIL